MTDPYKELQVSPTASDDEVKAAYRELARKYHPDHYNGNPLSDLATEKMQVVNKAYDEIMTRRRQNGNGGQQPADYAGQQGPSQFSDIRRLIQSRRITDAEELLDGVPRDRRDAEWHFLKGCVYQTRGWLDEAYESYATACNNAPSNNEYKNAFAQLQWQRQTARTRGGGYSSSQDLNICNNACAALCCLNCCMSCCGGRGGC
ncbi:MAG: J domain-containing protein [Oscillospiraceae bacterium]|nr:J domain-containing protein [Oscillospiraceae bacterium]